MFKRPKKPIEDMKHAERVRVICRNLHEPAVVAFAEEALAQAQEEHRDLAALRDRAAARHKGA